MDTLPETAMETIDSLRFLGRNARTGGPLLPPLCPEDFGRIALGSPVEPGLLEEVRKFIAALTPEDLHRDPKLQFSDPGDLKETGWGVIFAEGTPSGVRRALGEL